MYCASSVYNRNLRFTLQRSVFLWVCVFAISVLCDNYTLFQRFLFLDYLNAVSLWCNLKYFGVFSAVVTR